MQLSQDSVPISPKCFPQDIPPPPKCFQHLLCLEDVNEGDIPANNVSLEKMGLKDLPSVAACESDSSEDDAHTLTSSSSTKMPGISITPTKTYQMKKDDSQGSSVDPVQFQTSSECDDSGVIPENKNLGKLNSSLSKLKKEMNDLRTLDVNLFFQLLSLHEAIQDFKMTAADRYSETGSEYSLGSASYMGSMSSLSEEDSDWMEGWHYQHSGKSGDESQVFIDNQNATSLLDQITALVQKTDADF